MLQFSQVSPLKKGGVIAAGAVVTESTEPNAVYAGIPARKIRDLS